MHTTSNIGQSKFIVLFITFFTAHLLYQRSVLAQSIEEEILFDNSSVFPPFDGRLLCENGFEQTSQVCNELNDLKNTSHFKTDASHFFHFQLKDQQINLTLTKNQVYHPDASVSVDVLGTDRLHFYKEDISKALGQFYIGSFAFLNFSVPFSGEQRGNEFIGLAYLLKIKVNLSCNYKLMSQNIMGTHCFYCKVICSHYENVKTDTYAQDNIPTDPLFQIHDAPFFTHNSPDSVEDSKQTWKKPKHKRDTQSQPTPVSCSLHLVADQLFHKHIGSEDVLQVIHHMLRLINKLDAIFRSTDFNGDEWADNIGFLVKRVTVLKTIKSVDPTIAEPSMTSREYLERLSRHNFEEYCLAIAFTFRDFHGTAGSSYPAFSDKTMSGGICQRVVTRDGHGLSFNIAVVTYLLEGQQRSEIEVLLTLAHEVGHSFGAQHDKESGCSGDKEHGNYIMSGTTNSGYQANHQKFSACSLRSMLPVIKKKGGCLIRGPLTPQCGNGLPEEGEECDCGWSRNCDDIDPCCTPADDTRGEDRPCTLRRSQGKLCSPQVSSCCTETCTYTPATRNFVCNTNTLNKCSQVSRCDGQSPHCPLSHVSVGTPCNGGLQVCTRGDCSMGVCEFHKLSTCLCQGTSLCEICCKQNETCAPLRNFTSRKHPVYLHGGAPCVNGYCSSRNACLRPEPAGSGLSARSSDVNRLQLHLKQYWLQYLLTSSVTLFIVVVLAFSYSWEDSDHFKAMRYGKMMSVVALGEHMGQVYDEMLQEVDSYYAEAIRKYETRTMPMDHIEAVGRLKALFPDISIEYLSRIAQLSATEEVAVKLLIIQGFRMRQFAS